MIYFRSDYSQGAHPKVLQALANTNFEHTDGYGLDEHCQNAASMIKELIGNANCHVHMMIGGTPCNITVICAALRPYEAVISAKSGHIYAHETGGVEATGHRIITVPGKDGKVYPAVTNVGNRPTVNGHHTTVEPWILDYSGDLYDREITLRFHYFIRPEMKFASLEELQQEIFRNAEEARAYLKNI